MNWHPLQFVPLYHERVWGGDGLSTVFHRQLPPGGPFGESWEIADRPDSQSRVRTGPLAGRTLTDLVGADPTGLLGEAATRNGRFPLLVKILDAREPLSVQVHPPAEVAALLGGEPKTELWYFIHTAPDADLLVGLRRGVDRAEFERHLAEGTVDRCLHRVRVNQGDALFLPSGRVHALGAGMVLFEIQESSDTTYRVFDWNRRGLDGRPRVLHVRESMASIDFTDAEPALARAGWQPDGATEVRRLVHDPRFDAEVRRAPAGATWGPELRRCAVLGVARGDIAVQGTFDPVRLGPGDFCLLPAALQSVEVVAEPGAEWVVAWPGASWTPG